MQLNSKNKNKNFNNSYLITQSSQQVFIFKQNLGQNKLDQHLWFSLLIVC